MLDRSTYVPYALEPIEAASRDEIAALQLQRLKWTLQHAYDNVPACRRKLDAAGARPTDLKRLEDLARFPFTTKQDLRENYPFGMFAVPREKIVRIHASSGTTGKPTVVGYTQRDIDTWADLVALMRDGVRRGTIETLRPEHDSLLPGGLGSARKVYVYRRAGEPCLVCGTPITHGRHLARNLFWCPTCQPEAN